MRRSKPHLSKHYPMHPTFRKVLESYEERTGRVFKKWLHIDTISKHVKMALINAGFEYFRLHDLRHTFASNLAEAGESLHSIGELLGHTDKRTTEIYAHLSSGHLTQSIQKLTYQPE
ncbi:tyrosine-type recombinase/integrase [Maridesulfovibrio sp.]|uniref:tyrosine-type recombinase/integrase n=1 Tax=unclassified Maridesulfovibrio TaxID=2794999 RepID=UPI003AFF8F91